jgi:hypothetical protein
VSAPRGLEPSEIAAEPVVSAGAPEAARIEDIPKAALDFVTGLMQHRKQLDLATAASAARACCRAVAPSTLRNYLECVRGFERFAGEPLWQALPIEETLVLDFLTYMRD